jgi:hypothetical protein
MEGDAMIDLDDPNYNHAIRIVTAATAASIKAADGDPQPAVRALAFVLSMYLDADASIATNRAIRERGNEVGKVVAGQIRWLRENREDEYEPVLHALMREMARSMPAPSVN